MSSDTDNMKTRITSKIKLRMEKLTQLLIQANSAYFVEHHSIMSDSEYDSLYQELDELESICPEYISKLSPIKQIEPKISGNVIGVFHVFPMLSLNKAHSKEDLEKFDSKTDADSYVISHKIDGIAVSLQYHEGKFIKASTRGDGRIGQDITDKIIHISDIPQTLPFPIDAEVRGEIYVRKDTFRIHNEFLEKKFSTPRHMVSGTLLRIDSDIKHIGLRFFAYDSMIYTGHDKFSDLLSDLTLYGFPVVPYQVLYSTYDIMQNFEEMKSFRKDIIYEIDGLVIRVNDKYLQFSLGSTNKAPRYAIALKFPPKSSITKLLSVTIGKGKTGKESIVGHLEPIKIDNVLISNVNLYSRKYIKEQDIRIGDSLVIARAGDVIPKVLSVVTEGRTGLEEEIKYESDLS